MSLDRDKKELEGLSKVLERYSYLDDVVSELKGITGNLSTSFKSRIEFYLRRRDVTLKKKYDLVGMVKEHCDRANSLASKYIKEHKSMSSTERRMLIQKIISILKDMIRKAENV